MPDQFEIQSSEKTKFNKKYDYSYPEGLDLHPDSKTHENLRQKILRTARESHDVMQVRHKTWKKLDEKLTAYIAIDSEEEKVKLKDSRKPVTIVVPTSYAILETLLTYRTAYYLNDEIFKLRPSDDPADLLPTLVLQSIINRDCMKSKVGLNLHTQWRDGFVYGFGGVLPYWDKKTRFRDTTVDDSDTFLGIPLNKKTRDIREEYTSFEGNALMNLDPYNVLPDTSVPIHDVENMQQLGFVDRKHITYLLGLERHSEDIFNVRYLKDMSERRSQFYKGDQANTGRYTKTKVQPGDALKQPDSGENTCDTIWYFMWIIPKDEGLGAGEYPELWQFALSGDRVIIQATPLINNHNRIPASFEAPTYDGHTTLPVSLMEIDYPMQEAIDWLWSSHVTTVRKHVNNMIIYDPSMINSNDLVDTKSGMLARTRAAAWGKDIKSSIFQLPVTDVTKQNINDIQTLMAIRQRVTGVNDSAQGYQERRGERVSASEARATQRFALSRLEKMAKISGMQSHFDIAEMFISNSVQFLSGEQKVKITGEYEQELLKEYGTQYFSADISKIDPAYDVIPQTNMNQSGENAATWVQLLELGSKSPETFQSLDFTRAWLHVARLLGADNPSNFYKTASRIQSQVQSPEQIEQGVQEGKLRTMEEVE